MDSGRHWSRRSILGASAAVAGVGVTGLAATVWIGGSSSREVAASFPELLRRAVVDLDLPCNSADTFLSAAVGGERERDITGIVASVQSRLGMHGASTSQPTRDGLPTDPTELTRRLARAIKDDFTEGALCLVDGWELSMTECRIAALKLLWEREQHPGAQLACRKEPLRATAPAPIVSRLLPPGTSVSVPFTVQPNGRSVINIYGSNFQPGAGILLDDLALRASVGHSGWMNAYVPAEIYSRERIVDVAVRNPDGAVSNVMQFRVVAPAVVPPPKLSRVAPPRTPVGVPFTVQPNGMSVINVYGAEFQAGAEIWFNDTRLESAVGNARWMNAYVPAELYSREGDIAVSVRNPDGKVSNVMQFEVVSGNGN